MPTVVSLEPTPLDVEGFAPSCERSAGGALRLIPRRPVDVTADELDHLRGTGIRFRLLPQATEVLPPAPEPVQDAVRADELRTANRDGAGGGRPSRKPLRR